MENLSSNLAIIFLSILCIVLAVLCILLWRSKNLTGIPGRPGLPGPMGPMGMLGEAGHDHFRDSINLGIIHEEADYHTWLKGLNLAILHNARPETSNYIPGIGDTGVPKG